LVLDVATGTGRIPLVLFQQPAFRGQVLGLDRAVKMLNVARRDLAAFQNRTTLIQADAMALPFADNSFPAVTCLEALEFLPNPRQGLAELIRVLQPASPTQPHHGWLLLTNRTGWEARLLPGKTWSREKLAKILANFPLRYVDIQVWETIYDLVWAQKVERQKQVS
jgi:ubiquinone/menaquinone biosynthesis C-methylase UbiE